MPLIVIDVSHWQVPRDLDWVTAEAGGVVGVIAKATQGLGSEDPAFFEHSVDAYRDKMPLLGAYHFGDGSDGKRQAAHFLDRLHRAYGDDLAGLMLMLDTERNSPQMQVADAEDFVSAIFDSEKRWPWLYMGRDGPTGDGEGLPSPVLSNSPLLLPKYGPAPTAGNLPPGFRFPKDVRERAGVIRGWQFTDGKIHGGPFPGLGAADQSQLVGVDTLEEARALWA
jgi:lysozyme